MLSYTIYINQYNDVFLVGDSNQSLTFMELGLCCRRLLTMARTFMDWGLSNSGSALWNQHTHPRTHEWAIPKIPVGSIP